MMEFTHACKVAPSCSEHFDARSRYVPCVTGTHALQICLVHIVCDRRAGCGDGVRAWRGKGRGCDLAPQSDIGRF